MWLHWHAVTFIATRMGMSCISIWFTLERCLFRHGRRKAWTSLFHLQFWNWICNLGAIPVIFWKTDMQHLMCLESVAQHVGRLLGVWSVGVLFKVFTTPNTKIHCIILFAASATQRIASLPRTKLFPALSKTKKSQNRPRKKKSTRWSYSQQPSKQRF